MHHLIILVHGSASSLSFYNCGPEATFSLSNKQKTDGGKALSLYILYIYIWTLFELLILNTVVHNRGSDQ